jgi:hypothetical protein
MTSNQRMQGMEISRNLTDEAVSFSADFLEVMRWIDTEWY